MPNSTIVARSHACFRIAPLDNVRPSVDQFTERRIVGNSRLECYLEGWAQADAAIIRMAVTPGYRFHDPLVGTFSRHSLQEYFDLLQDRFSGSGEIERLDTAFSLRGLVDHRSCPVELRFYREAPRIGLTGISRVKITERGVITETVEYDLNPAADMLRCGSLRRRSPGNEASLLAAPL